jgi:signal transduction histidine kinase
LIPAIKWKLEQIEKEYEIETSFKSSVDFSNINDYIKILLYRIICELLTNIIKHADSDLIVMEVKNEQKSFHILIFDNGKGFDYQSLNYNQTETGFGLFSVKERLDSIDGSISIKSKNGKGTKISITIPEK